MEFQEIGEGLSVNYVPLASEPADQFLAVRITAEGQEVVARDADIERLVRRLRERGIEDAILTTSGQGTGTTVY